MIVPQINVCVAKAVYYMLYFVFSSTNSSCDISLHAFLRPAPKARLGLSNKKAFMIRHVICLRFSGVTLCKSLWKHLARQWSRAKESWDRGVRGSNRGSQVQSVLEITERKAGRNHFKTERKQGLKLLRNNVLKKTEKSKGLKKGKKDSYV